VRKYFSGEKSIKSLYLRKEASSPIPPDQELFHLLIFFWILKNIEDAAVERFRVCGDVRARERAG
jgi:hypothetical protein